MNTYASGGRPAESDPNNPMNKEGRTLVREEREPPVNPPIPKKKPVKKAEGGEVGGDKKSGGGRKFDAGKFAMSVLSPLGGLLMGSPVTSPILSLLQGKNPMDPFMSRRRRGPEDTLMRSTGAAPAAPGMKKGGMVKKKANGGSVKKMAKGGSVKSSASRRGDGCAQRGKTRGRMI